MTISVKQLQFPQAVQLQRVGGVPSAFKADDRRCAIDREFESGLNFKATKMSGTLDVKIKAARKKLQKVRLNFLQVLILRIANFVIKIFKRNYSKIDGLLQSNRMVNRLIKKYSEMLNPHKIKHEHFGLEKLLSGEQVGGLVRIGLYTLQEYQLKELQRILASFKRTLEGNEDHQEAYQELPRFIKDSLDGLLAVRDVAVDEFMGSGEHRIAVIDQLHGVYGAQAESYLKLIQLERGEFKENTHPVDADTSNKEPVAPVDTKTSDKDPVAPVDTKTQKEDILASIQRDHQLIKGVAQAVDPDEDDGAVYDVSCDRLKKKISEDVLDKPIRVTMVGVEYASLIKQGGLAEAVEGLSRGILKLNPANRVKLVFPKYSHLPKDVLEGLSSPKKYVNAKGEEYYVYSYEIDGVTCQFIHHPSFSLDGAKPDIYGPTMAIQAERFATFSELAADLIYKQKDTDIIHLHDWHVSGVALKLKKDHEEEWKEGKIPPVLFTYHNNNRSSQGRICMGAYSYDPVIKGYQDHGITDNHDNLFVKTLMLSDAVTTVSERFGIESQTVDYGEGVGFAVKQAAKVGKLTGIINGTNPDRWNPEADRSLMNWKDITTGKPVDLSYGPSHTDVLGKKQKCKAQLQKWVERYIPKADIDFTKPVVTYVGRFDSSQKGLDKFEEAIVSTLRSGGQFICMGISEDAAATGLLDKLQKKYPRGVLFIRDYKGKNGRLHYQHGDQTRPGIGSLVRASTDFLFVPSKFEPCGLVQFEGWLFGSLAIGSKTGGLADTIIPKESDAKRFNGYLFERDGSEEKSAGFVIEQALTSWQMQSVVDKERTIKRIITEGRQYSWSTSPKGFSPAQNYRLAYENARQRVKWRKASYEKYDKIEALRHRITDHPSNGELSSLEEEYLCHFYMHDLDSLTLDKMYRRLPEKLRAAVPSPYGRGVNYSKYETYGSFFHGRSVFFNVLAPKARNVRVVLINEDEMVVSKHSMEKNGRREWIASIPGIKPGQRYLYEINGKLKLDPYARSHAAASDKKLPLHSVVSAEEHQWNDKAWMTQRKANAGKPGPMSIYELHPTTWKKKNGKPLNYRELAHELVKHCKKLGYTHVELMGILEHPYDETWGYLVTGYFSPSNRMGSAEDFKYMMDYLHQHNVGAILDWVPAHFAKEGFGLGNFDGSSLYEAKGVKYAFSIRKNFLNYGAKQFDYSKKEVREFLISSAAFWLKKMHVDGLRIDCVRSMLNTEDKTAANLFMRDLNAVVHRHCSGGITIAEEFSGNTKVTAPVYKEGLGFDMKWHVGWMNHTLKYFAKPLAARKGSYEQIKQAVMCDNHHKQVMAFSHDQLKKGAGTLLNKNSSLKDSKTRYANVRAMLSFMMCLPGKKLHFMGAECGNKTPWNLYLDKKKGLLDDIDMEKKGSAKLMSMIASLNTIYKTKKPFWEHDDNGQDIKWIKDPQKRIHAYRRKSSDGASYACFHNFTGKEVKEFTIVLKKKKGKVLLMPEEIFNSDDLKFGGRGRNNIEINTKESEGEVRYTIKIPPLSSVVIKEIA